MSGLLVRVALLAACALVGVAAEYWYEHWRIERQMRRLLDAALPPEED